MNWIKIADKLPKSGKRVLVLCQPDNVLLMGVYYNFSNQWCLYYSDGCHILNEEVSKITHWITLPKLPHK